MASVFFLKKRHNSLCQIAGCGLADVGTRISTIDVFLSAVRLIIPQCYFRFWRKTVVPVVVADLMRVVSNTE
ncbi:MAG: hypothetical protein OES46_01425 [Gammaproteobacteria bacterium]|jgi:hypothetical protein|nr:hypothetical protein [Gammaproteobacteria bacterium]